MNISQLTRFVPLLIGIVILVIGSLFVPWPKVLPYLSNLTPLTLLFLFICSIFYYLGRILRYWLMLRFLNQPVRFDRVALACLIAQPIAILPGGELYRGAMLRRYGNVPLRDGLPSVFAQSLAETTGLLIVALIGAAFLRRYVGILLIAAVILFTVVMAVRWRHAHKSHKAINKVPFVSISKGRLKGFLSRNRTLLSGTNFLLLLAAAYVSIFAGIAAVFITVNAFGGSLNIFEAAISFALPVMLESISFLPGGIGVNEQGSVGMLSLFGVTLPMAVAATIAVRLTTLGSGFIYGFIAFGIAKLAKYKEYS